MPLQVPDVGAAMSRVPPPVGVCEARPEYGSATAATWEFWMTPQPLLARCALPMLAFRLWPWQVALVFDITSQPCMLASGAPLEVMPSTPLLARARMQNE